MSTALLSTPLNFARYCLLFLFTNLAQVVRFQVLKVASIKLVFWDVAPCSHVEVDRCFRGVYCLHHKGDHPDDGGSTHL
jgi:hypothetical protein